MKIGSLFAGIGGIDLAFQQAGFEIAFANEIDKDACATYRHNFPDCRLIEDDIKKVDFSLLPDIDVLTAGFPCQPFSVCGKQLGFDDDRGNLFFEIMRAVDIKKPKVLFFENVANLVKHDKGNTFAVIQDELKKRNYSVDYLVADACNYGVPQHRTRIYIVAFSADTPHESFCFPEKRELTTHVFDILHRDSKAPEQYYLASESKHYAKMDAAISDNNQLYRFSDYGVQKGKDGISFTLKANMGTWYDREPIIRDDFGIRTLTPEECLSLMGYPQTYTFPDIPQKSKYKQCGNSVIVPLVSEIAAAIKNTLSDQAQPDTLTVYVGGVKNNAQIDACLQHHFYHLPKNMLSEEDAEKVQAIALYLPKRVFGVGGVKYIGKITGYRIVLRSDISELPKQSDELYYRFEISEWKQQDSVCIENYSKFGIYKLPSQYLD